MSWSGVILVVVGVVLLANNADLLPYGWLHQWWPVLIIALGVTTILRPHRGRRSPAPGRDDAARSNDKR